MVSFKWNPELAKTCIEEAREDGLEKGRKKGVFPKTLVCIHNLMETVHWTAQQAMDALKIPANERENTLRNYNLVLMASRLSTTTARSFIHHNTSTFSLAPIAFIAFFVSKTAFAFFCTMG